MIWNQDLKKEKEEDEEGGEESRGGVRGTQRQAGRREERVRFMPGRNSCVCGRTHRRTADRRSALPPFRCSFGKAERLRNVREFRLRKECGWVRTVRCSRVNGAGAQEQLQQLEVSTSSSSSQVRPHLACVSTFLLLTLYFPTDGNGSVFKFLPVFSHLTSSKEASAGFTSICCHSENSLTRISTNLALICPPPLLVHHLWVLSLFGDQQLRSGCPTCSTR